MTRTPGGSDDHSASPAGSGTTLEAAQREGFGFYGIELNEEYLQLIFDRLSKIHNTPAPTKN